MSFLEKMTKYEKSQSDALTSSVVVSINSIVGGIEEGLMTRAISGLHVQHFAKVLKSCSEWTDQFFPVERLSSTFP